MKVESKGANPYRRLLTITSTLLAAAIPAAFILYQPSPAANANQVRGYFIFTDSRPAGQYQFIANLQTNRVQIPDLTQPANACFLSYSQLRENLIDIAEKKHKGKGNAILITGDNSGELVLLP